MIDYAVYILTHGRPNNQKTLDTFKRFNYTHKVYLVLDDQDDTIQQYIDNYGKENIIIFNKNEYVKTTDTGLHNPIFKFAVYARNAIEDIAVSMGYKYFLMLDDDITNIRVRYNDNGSLRSYYPINKLDQLLTMCIEYMIDTQIACLSLGFCNSYRGGAQMLEKENPRQRFCAEAFIRCSMYKVDWRLNMVEDLITSLDCGIDGQVWLQFLPIQVEICMSEGAVSGGNSEAYRDFGKYRLSFFPTIVYPSFNIPRFINNHWVTTTQAQYSLPRIVSYKLKQK